MIEFGPNMVSSMGDPGIINRYLEQMIDTQKLARQLHGLRECQLLISAAKFGTGVSSPMSPDFSFIDNGDEAALAWFDSDRQAASKFVPFAMSDDAGLFAYWKISEVTPIVYLASECEGSRVVSVCASDFLSLVAYGSDDYNLDIMYTDDDNGEEWSGPSEISPALDSYRVWLKKEFDLYPTLSPLKMIRDAMSSTPNLMSWIRDWQNIRYGK